MTDEVDPDGLAVEKYRDYLMYLAQMQLGTRQDGKIECSDIVQKTLMEAHEKRNQFRGLTSGEMANWLRKMLAFNVQDEFVKFGRKMRDRSKERSLDEEFDRSSARLGALLVSDQSTPSQAAGRHENAVRVARALEKLPESQRQAVVLRHCQDCSLEEISRRMNKTPAAAAGLLKRGLRGLRAQLQEEE